MARKPKALADDPKARVARQARAAIKTLLGDAAVRAPFVELAAKDPATLEAQLIELQDGGARAEDVRRLRSIVKGEARANRKIQVVPREGLDAAPRVKDALPDAPVSDAAVIPAGFRLSEDGIVKECMVNGTFAVDTIALAPAVLTARLEYINTGREVCRLAFRRDGAWRTHSADRGTVFNASQLVGLADYGLPVHSDNARDVVRYLAKYEHANARAIPRARVSSNLGYQGEAGKLGFLHGRTLLTPDGSDLRDINVETIAPEEWRDDWIAFRGEDAGDEQRAKGYRTSGTRDEWLKAFGLVREFPRVAFAFYGGLASALLPIVGCPNFTVSLSYETSKGKTTALRFAGSAWGNPNERAADSTVLTWNATRVAIERTAAIVNGMPLLLDDTKKCKWPADIAKVLYDVTSGQGRARGSRLGLAASGSFSTVLLTTGEQRVTSFSKDGGTVTRVLELWGMPFEAATDETAVTVQRVNDLVISNYGFVGPELVRELLRRRDQWPAYRERYRQHQARLERLGREEHGGEFDSGAGRLAEYGAAVALAVELAEELTGLQAPETNPVDDLWPDITGEAGEADRGAEAFRSLVEWCCQNGSSFYGRHEYSQSGPKKPIGGWYGRWDNDEWEYLYIYPNVAERLLGEWGHDPDSIVRLWADRDWLGRSEENAKGPNGTIRRVVRNKRKERVDGATPWLFALKRSAIISTYGDPDS